MPDNALFANTLRTLPHSTPIYMSVMTGTPVLVASLTSTPVGQIKSLPISITSGSISDVKRGFRVVVRTSGGAWKGQVSVRAGGTLDSTHLPIRETTMGTLWFAAGDVVTVYDDVLISDKLVEDDINFKPDGLDVSDFNLNPIPIPCSGGASAGSLNSDGYCDFPMVGSSSYSQSGGALTHVWSAPGATYAVGSSTSADPTLRYSAAGKYLVTHTVTDSSNGKSRTQYVRLRVHDANDPPLEITLGDPTANEQNHDWTLPVTVYGSVTLDDLPDGAHVLIWCAYQAFGADVPSRSHILMEGYVRRDRELISPRNGKVEFDVISPIATLAGLPGFSKVMIRNASPDAWNEVANLTVKRGITQIITWYTWLIEAGYDFIFTGFDDADYSGLYLEKNNPLEQMLELTKARGARLVCKKTGRIEVQGELALEALADRAAITVTYTVDPDDVYASDDGSSGIEVSREHYRPLETYRARGLLAGTTVAANTSVYARFPESPGLGNQSETRDKFICLNKAELYKFCALFGAQFDGIFMNTDGSVIMSPKLNVGFQGAYWAIFDWHREYIAVQNYTVESQRGTPLDSLRYLFMGISNQYVNGTFRSTAQLAGETHAPTDAAVDDTPKSPDDLNIPTSSSITPPTFDPVIVPPPPTSSSIITGIRSGVAKLGFVSETGNIVVTASADVRGVDGGSAWEIADTIGSSTVQSVVQKYGTPSTLIAVDDDFIYKITGVGTPTITVTTVHTFTDGGPVGVRRTIKTQAPAPNRFVVTSYHGNFGSRCAYSADGGDTWSESTISLYADIGLANACGGATITMDSASLGITAAYTTSATYPFGTPVNPYGAPGAYRAYDGGTTQGFNGSGQGHGPSDWWWGRTNNQPDGHGTYMMHSAIVIEMPDDTCALDTLDFWFYLTGPAPGSFFWNIYVSYWDASKVQVGTDELAWQGVNGSPYYLAWTNIVHSMGGKTGVKYICLNAATWAGTSNPVCRFDDILINGGYGSGGGTAYNHTPTLHMSTRTAGLAYTIGYNSSGSPRCYKTTNGGATWALDASLSLLSLYRIGNILGVPLTAPTTFYHIRAGAPPSFSPYELVKVVGTTVTEISPDVSGTTYAMPGVARHELAIADNNASRLVLIGRASDTATATGLWRSSTGGSTWQNVLAPGSCTFAIVEIGSNGSSVFLLGEDSFGYSGDFLTTLDDRSGNLAALSAGKPVYMFEWGS